MEVSRNKLLMAISATVVVLLVLVGLRGMKMYKAESFCSDEVYRCRGVYAGECIGFVDKETRYYSEARCPVSNITSECNRIGEKICSINNRSIGTSWADSASVEGKTCSEWSRQYDVNLTSC